MPGSIVQWCAEIGVFNARLYAKRLKLKYRRSICFSGSYHLYIIDCLNTEGTKIDSLATSYDFSQIISDPTHILPNSSSCTDLTFTNQPNLGIESSGVQPSLHPN